MVCKQDLCHMPSIVGRVQQYVLLVDCTAHFYILMTHDWIYIQCGKGCYYGRGDWRFCSVLLSYNAWELFGRVFNSFELFHGCCAPFKSRHCNDTLIHFKALNILQMLQNCIQVNMYLNVTKMHRPMEYQIPF